MKYNTIIALFLGSGKAYRLHARPIADVLLDIEAQHHHKHEHHHHKHQSLVQNRNKEEPEGETAEKIEQQNSKPAAKAVSQEQPPASSPASAEAEPVGNEASTMAPGKEPVAPAASKEAPDGGDGQKKEETAPPVQPVGLVLDRHTIPHNPEGKSSVITDPKELAKQREAMSIYMKSHK